jgi:hypothetical protein
VHTRGTCSIWRIDKANIPIEYGPTSEPWGVRRFFVRDPFGKLINILVHERLTPLASRPSHTSKERMDTDLNEIDRHYSTDAPGTRGNP